MVKLPPLEVQEKCCEWFLEVKSQKALVRERFGIPGVVTPSILILITLNLSCYIFTESEQTFIIIN